MHQGNVCGFFPQFCPCIAIPTMLVTFFFSVKVLQCEEIPFKLKMNEILSIICCNLPFGMEDQVFPKLTQYTKT